eukprot:SAG31_NODE_1685_length_7530_cov_9.464944_2_plen_68_part_00
MHARAALDQACVSTDGGLPQIAALTVLAPAGSTAASFCSIKKLIAGRFKFSAACLQRIGMPEVKQEN